MLKNKEDLLARAQVDELLHVLHLERLHVRLGRVLETDEVHLFLQQPLVELFEALDMLLAHPVLQRWLCLEDREGLPVVCAQEFT